MEHPNPNQIHFTSNDEYVADNNYLLYNNPESEFHHDLDFFMLPSSPAQATLIIDSGLQTAFNDDSVEHQPWMDMTESGSLLMVTPLCSLVSQLI